jgi:hypothetical protein
MPTIITEYPQFVTITNLEWKKLLKPDKYKDIVLPCWCSSQPEANRLPLLVFVPLASALAITNNQHTAKTYTLESHA